MLTRPEIRPVPARGGAHEKVLEDDGEEEPEDDFPLEDTPVEGGGVSRGLPVVGWEAEVEDQTDSPQEESDGDGDGGDGPTVRDEGVLYGLSEDGGVVDACAPVPEGGDVELLRALDDAGAEGPCLDGCRAWGS